MSGRWGLPGLAAGLLALLPGMAAAQAECLFLDQSGAFDAFRNSCNIGIDFDFTDEDTCSGWRCSGYVGAGGVFQTQALSGLVEWYACYSDGNGEVIVDCNPPGQNCRCKD